MSYKTGAMSPEEEIDTYINMCNDKMSQHDIASFIDSCIFAGINHKFILTLMERNVPLEHIGLAISLGVPLCKKLLYKMNDSKVDLSYFVYINKFIEVDISNEFMDYVLSNIKICNLTMKEFRCTNYHIKLRDYIKNAQV